METLSGTAVRRIFNSRDEHITDRTASFYELEPFDSLEQALQCKHLKRRLPACLKRTLRNRFMLPNMMNVGYAIGLLVIDYNENFNPPTNSTSANTLADTSNGSKAQVSILDQPVQNDPYVNQLYIGKLAASKMKANLTLNSLRSFFFLRPRYCKCHCGLALLLGLA